MAVQRQLGSTNSDTGCQIESRFLHMKDCKINMFQLEKSTCNVVGMAEISVDDADDNAGDGFEIGLILYQVDSLNKSDE